MLWPFKVISGVNDKPMITVKYKGQEKLLCAEEISSIVLTNMREIAEAYLVILLKMQLSLCQLISMMLKEKPPWTLVPLLA